MSLKQMQGQYQAQAPLTSAHIAQTMTLLYMTSAETAADDRCRTGQEPRPGSDK